MNDRRYSVDDFKAALLRAVGSAWVDVNWATVSAFLAALPKRDAGGEPYDLARVDRLLDRVSAETSRLARVDPPQPTTGATCSPECGSRLDTEDLEMNGHYCQFPTRCFRTARRQHFTSKECRDAGVCIRPAEPKVEQAKPSAIPMRIPCPTCSTLHIDEGEFATKPHHTHSCQNCGLTWRPAVEHTVGVQFLPGFKNTPASSPKVEPALAMPDHPQHPGEPCPGCQKVARHPGEGYVCSWHPPAPSRPEPPSVHRQDGIFIVCAGCHARSIDGRTWEITKEQPTTPEKEPTSAGGVPDGFVLGSGWEAGLGYTQVCGFVVDLPARYYCGKAATAWTSVHGACAAHAVEMGALVPVQQAAEPARAACAFCSHYRFDHSQAGNGPCMGDGDSGCPCDGFGHVQQAAEQPKCPGCGWCAVETKAAEQPFKCEICGWPLRSTPEQGCVAGNCSYRPHYGTEEWYRIQKRRAAMKCDRPEPPSTGGVPDGFVLGEGWRLQSPYHWKCFHGYDQGTGTGRADCVAASPYMHSNNERAACPRHAVEMGALVPVQPAEEVDWSRFVPTGEVPEVVGRDEPDAGTVVASWSKRCRAGSVRRWATGTEDPVRLAGEKRFHRAHYRIVRHADGRWADGFNPSGPCKDGCGKVGVSGDRHCTGRGGEKWAACFKPENSGDEHPCFCTEFCRTRARNEAKDAPVQQAAEQPRCANCGETRPEWCNCKKQAAEPSAPAGHRVVGRSGPGVEVPPRGTWIVLARLVGGQPRDRREDRPMDAPMQVNWAHRSPAFVPWWNAGCFDILEPIAEPSAPVDSQPTEQRPTERTEDDDSGEVPMHEREEERVQPGGGGVHGGERPGECLMVGGDTERKDRDVHNEPGRSRGLHSEEALPLEVRGYLRVEADLIAARARVAPRILEERKSRDVGGMGSMRFGGLAKDAPIAEPAATPAKGPNDQEREGANASGPESHTAGARVSTEGPTGSKIADGRAVHAIAATPVAPCQCGGRCGYSECDQDLGHPTPLSEAREQFATLEARVASLTERTAGLEAQLEAEEQGRDDDANAADRQREADFKVTKEFRERVAGLTDERDEARRQFADIADRLNFAEEGAQQLDDTIGILESQLTTRDAIIHGLEVSNDELTRKVALLEREARDHEQAAKIAHSTAERLEHDLAEWTSRAGERTAQIDTRVAEAVEEERERCMAWWYWFWEDTARRNVQASRGMCDGTPAPKAGGTAEAPSSNSEETPIEYPPPGR